MAGWLLKFRNIGIGTLLLIVSAVSLVVAMLLTIGLSSHIRHQALHDLASEDVRQTSQIIFQSVYAVMTSGGDRKDIDTAVAGLGKTYPRLNVDFYSVSIRRSEIVNHQFGAFLGDQQAVERDPDLKRVMADGKESLLFPTDKAVRYLYPVLGEEKCLQCHTEGRAGAVFGVIDITYPVNELKVQFAYVINSILGYTLLMIASVFILLYIALRKLVAVPLRDFAATVRDIEPKLEFDRRVSLRYLVAELGQLSDDFNHLLGTIGGYSAKLVEFSTTDALTGLFNRRRFDEHLMEEIDRSNRYGSKFSVLMIDVDDFKHINDNYGHPAGDLALQKIAEIMRGSLRNVDVPARLGGDEFAVILPETVGANAMTVAQRLRTRVNSSVLHVPAGEVRITCSIGFISYPVNVPEKDKQALYKAMDDMLYKAKHLGKDQVASPD
jgi:diguanylate cyclase (GGDEF)-like protein